MDNDIHTIQAHILKAIVFKEEAKFGELNTQKISTDHFTFHIKQLLERGIIEKTTKGLYRLTLTGKEYASRFDVDSGQTVKIEKQAKLGVLVVLHRGEGNKSEYLMQHRLKQPFFGYRGFVTGKIKIGESVTETAERELLEETGLTAECKHKSIYHERIFSEKGELLEDKYFFIFLAQNLSGELITDFEGGKNEWLNKKDILKGNIFYDIEDIVGLANSSKFIFGEKSYTVEKY